MPLKPPSSAMIRTMSRMVPRLMSIPRGFVCDHQGPPEINAEKRAARASSAAAERQQKDDRDRDAQQPKKNSATHDHVLLSVVTTSATRYRRVRRNREGARSLGAVP